ncbi:hypothetical protein [Flavobacterium sp. 3HN19-14]|uniref:hypothetical protein n=1 Tax=Flavobacterium sp. 3HN19-14 TaxID=3448133 RepID=UPI003EDFB579
MSLLMLLLITSITVPTQTITTYLNSVNIPVSTNVSGTFTYNLTGVSYAGVSGCSQVQTGSAAITVNKLPTATVTPSSNTVCVGAPNPTVTFTGADGTGLTLLLIMSIMVQDQTITTTTGDSVTVSVPTTVAGVFNYNLISVSSGTGTSVCEQPQAGVATVYVGVYAEVSAPFTAICPGYSVTLKFKGTPNAVINFTSAPTVGSYSVTLDASGQATYTPFVSVTNTFTLTNGSIASPLCSNTLSDSATVLVNSTIACTQNTKAEIEIEDPIAVCTPGDCTQLTASYYNLRDTSAYHVISTPYQNLYDYTGGTILNAPCDDAWTKPYTMPFNFCFYGVTYNQVRVGTNGVITFDISGAQTYAGAPNPVWPDACPDPELPTGSPLKYCPYALNGTIPSSTFVIKNGVFGVYQDTDIRPVGNDGGVTDPLVQNVNYYVQGIAPNRYFVANFNELPQYRGSQSASAGLQTTQIVLHETTNIIEVYVKRRKHYQPWQGGVGVIGILDATGLKAVTPPGRNTGNWDANNEAWRFLPAG